MLLNLTMTQGFLGVIRDNGWCIELYGISTDLGYWLLIGAEAFVDFRALSCEMKYLLDCDTDGVPL